MSAPNKKFMVIGNMADSYFALDIADFLQQTTDWNDLMMLKTFANSEFCPRFTIHDEDDFESIGESLEGTTVIIVSVHRGNMSRNELAMRNLIIARAAKDNGAKEVILVEPDLFFSAQDRGPKPDQGYTNYVRDIADYHKFNGQAFTARLYACLLKESGVDVVITIHNHSLSTRHEYVKVFGEQNFVNLYPDSFFNYYIKNADIVDPKNTVLVAPDKGAFEFVSTVATYKDSNFPVVVMDKVRTGERKLHMAVSPTSPYPVEAISGKDVVVLDDMVRTGGTIATCCKILQQYGPRKIIFLTTHFYSSEETKVNLSTSAITEIITTSTLPSILNRDNQGRLRKKMAVLKINKWIAAYLNERLELGLEINEPLYVENMSDKNPRSKEHRAASVR